VKTPAEDGIVVRGAAPAREAAAGKPEGAGSPAPVSARRLEWLLWAVNFLMIVAFAVFAVAQSVDALYFDDITLGSLLPAEDGTTPGFRAFLSPHNFSRPVTWRVLGVLALYPLRFSPRLYSLLPCVAVILVSLLMLRFIADRSRTRLWSLVTWTAVNCLLLSFVHEVSVCWGACLGNILPLPFAIGLLIWYRRCRTTTGRIAGYAVAVTLAIASNGNGVCVAVLLPAGAFSGPWRKRVGWWLLPVIVGVLFYRYYLPRRAFATAEGIDVGRAATFFFTALGHVFGQQALPSMAFGILALLLFVGIAIELLIRKKLVEYLPTLLLGAFGLLSVLMLAAGRHRNLEHALIWRYSIFELGFLVPLVVLVSRRFFSTGSRFASAAMCCGFLLGFYVFQSIAVSDALARSPYFSKEVRTLAKEALEFSNVMPRHPALKLACPGWEPAAVSTRAKPFFRHGIMRYRIADRVVTGRNPRRLARGGFDTCVRMEDGTLRVSGWSLNDAGARDRVLFLAHYEDGRVEPVGLLFTGGHRPDVAEHFGSARYEQSGFCGRLFPSDQDPQPFSVSAWVVHPEGRRLTRLPGPMIPVPVD